MNHFDPSIARARECRRAMDEALWSSVRDLLSEQGGAGSAAGVFGSGDVANDDEPANLLDYGAYFDLTLTPPAEAEVPSVAKAAALYHLEHRLPAIVMREPQAAPLRISNFSPDDYTADELERMRRWWDIEPRNRMALVCASAEEVERSQRLIGIAMGHLHDASPDLWEELHTIVRDVVLSRPDGTNLINYGGASSFALWGALTINVETHLEWIQFYRQIVHEAAHNLLFGIARDEPLVTDDPSDRVASPIRADPRPMDGVFHAAFVSAREALAIDSLLCRHEDTGCLVADDARVLEDVLEISVLAFWDCLETLRGGAQITGLGKAILADCEAYMTANFAVEAC